MAASGTSAGARLRMWCSRGVFGRGSRAGTLARVWAAFLAALVVAAMLPMAASAQIYADNSHLTPKTVSPGNSATSDSDSTSGGWTRFIQPFTVPSGGEAIRLKQVKLWFNERNDPRVEYEKSFAYDTPFEQNSRVNDSLVPMRLYLYSSDDSRDNAGTGFSGFCRGATALFMPDDGQIYDENCAFKVPNIVNSRYWWGPPGAMIPWYAPNVNAGTYVGEFRHLTGRAEVGENVFEVVGEPDWALLQHGETYHIYLYMGDVNGPGWEIVEHPSVSTEVSAEVSTMGNSIDTYDNTVWTFEPRLQVDADGAAVHSIQPADTGGALEAKGKQRIQLIGEPNHPPDESVLSFDDTIASPTGEIAAGDTLRLTGVTSTGDVFDLQPGDGVDSVFDENGVSSATTYTYEWDIVESDGTTRVATIASVDGIADTNSKSYGVTDDVVRRLRPDGVPDPNRKIRVTVTYTDDDAYAYDAASDPTNLARAVFEADNQPVGVPMITRASPIQAADDFEVGQTLTADVSGISDADGPIPLSFDYQWWRADEVQRDGSGINESMINGAMNSTYELVPADAGKVIKVQVSFTDDDRNSYTRHSDWTALVNGPPTWINPNRDPQIAGTPQVGMELRADTRGINDPNGLTNSTFTYQWMQEDSNGRPIPISGAESDRFTPRRVNQGREVWVVIGFTDDDTFDESIESSRVGPISRTGNTAAFGDVIFRLETVRGREITSSDNAKVGETLFADITGIDDDDGLPTEPNWMYRWWREDASGLNRVNITSGFTTSNTYTAERIDWRKRIGVTVMFMDNDGDPETITSMQPVLIEPPDNTVATGVTIDGTQEVGRRLTANTDDIVDPDGVTSATYLYQWWKVDADRTSNRQMISGATSKFYTPVAADEDKRIYVVVSFDDDYDNPEAIQSPMTDPLVVVLNRGLQAKVLTNILSGFSHSLATNFVDIIWQRASSSRSAGGESFANLGGRSLDTAALSSGDPSRTAVEFAKFLGIEVVPAARAAYGAGSSTHRTSGGSGVEAYRNWAGIPDSDFAKRSSFELALNGGAAGGGSPVLWARGDIRSFKNAVKPDTDSAHSLSARDAGASLGIERRVDNSIVGLVVVSSERDTDYVFDDVSFGRGEATASLMTVAPWFHWTAPVGYEVWATFGQGVGTAEIDDELGTPVEVDIDQQLIAGGFRGVAQIFEEMHSAVKADAFITSSSSDEAANLAGVSSEASRVRMAIEASTQQPFGRSGGQANYIFEIGVRYDDGEAVSGTGMDFLTEFRYASPSSGLIVHGQGSLLVQHSQDEYEAWGLAGGVEWDPGPSDLGLQLSLQPTWNATITRAAVSKWNAAEGTEKSSDSGAAMVAWIGYGVGVLRERAVATAYSELTGAEDENRLRLGAELRQQNTVMGSMALDLYGERRNTLSGHEDAVMLESSLGF